MILSALSKQVVDAKVAQYGMLHRPNVGIDYLMVFQSYGVKFMDDKTGKLMFPRRKWRRRWAGMNAMRVKA